MTGTYDLQPHTADVAIEATGDSLSAVFGAVADGLAAAHLDAIPETDGKDVSVTVSAESRTALLFDYLDRLIYVRDIEGVLPVDNQATVGRNDEWHLEATARGIDTAAVAAREVKGVTYSEMDLSEQDGEYHAYVVVDV